MRQSDLVALKERTLNDLRLATANAQIFLACHCGDPDSFESRGARALLNEIVDGVESIINSKMVGLPDSSPSNERAKEHCSECGKTDFIVARDMKGTRFCECGNSWEPIKNLNET